MNVARLIDSTLLRPDATPRAIQQICREGMEYGFASVCVNPAWVSLAASLLKGSPVNVCTVVGFPLGASTAKVKVFEAEDAVSNGAGELDMVMNIGALKAGNSDSVAMEIRDVLKSGALLKVIIETGLLSEEEKVRACHLVEDGGAHFVKTCTGFGPGQATEDDVRLIRSVVGDRIGVKASGGIRDYATVKSLVRAGATRVGTSTAVKIVKEETEFDED